MDRTVAHPVRQLLILLLDDEEVSLVIDQACPGGGITEDNNGAGVHDDDNTLSVGPDMPELPLDATFDQETAEPPTAEDSINESIQPAEKETEAIQEVEQGTAEDESTVREDHSSAVAHVDHENVVSAEQEGLNTRVDREEERREEKELDEEEGEQRGDFTPQAEEEVTGVVEEKGFGEKTQSKLNPENYVVVSENVSAATFEGPTEENSRSQEAVEVVVGNLQEVGEGEERGCVPCTCQSLFSNYDSHAPMRRKNRPCSLPVSELETVIASACGEPETPRTHYIRIHHLLHSLPSAQHRSSSQQEEEETGERENINTSQDSTSTSPTLKTSIDREKDEKEEEDTTHSPSQV